MLSPTKRHLQFATPKFFVRQHHKVIKSGGPPECLVGRIAPVACRARLYQKPFSTSKKSPFKLSR